MDEMSSTIPEAEEGKGKPEDAPVSTWTAFCNWARQPASRGFVVGAASVAVALVLERSNRRSPILY
jgi:hypothetical protein